MRAYVKTMLLLLLTVFAFLLAGEEARGALRLSKLKARMMPWPSKGDVNRFPAYKILASPAEEFLNFSYAPNVFYRVVNDMLEYRDGEKWERITSACKLQLNLEFPSGAKKKTLFEIFAPNDPKHYSNAVDRLQWKMRNPCALCFQLEGLDFVLLDADANGRFFDFGVDKICNVKFDDYKGIGSDPFKLKWVPFSNSLKIGEKVFTFATGTKGKPQYIEMSPDFDDLTARGLGYLNDVRAQCGLEPVTFDPALSALLKKHCDYCANSGVSKIENPKSYHYNAAAAKVAKYSFACAAATPSTGIRSALSTLYARNMLLSPKAKMFGAALSNNIFCIGGVKAVAKEDFIPLYPFRRQKRVLVRYVPEEPEAFRDGQESYSGTFIVIGNVGSNCKVVSASLKPIGKGSPIKLSISTPSDPPNENVRNLWPDNRHGITILPEEPLKAATYYRVKIEYLDGEKLEKRTELEWLFQTETTPFR